ncbi:hypothetical protein [Phenylobacterium sp.]|uniref:hypothetical protein n=1 Tax=Phenylobacterium sp. TaxID=1871053 RepID=UPI0035B21003
MSGAIDVINGLTVQLVDDVGPSRGVIPDGAVSDDLSPTVRVQFGEDVLSVGDTLRAVVNGVETGVAHLVTAVDLARGYLDLSAGAVEPGAHEIWVSGVIGGQDAASASVDAFFETRPAVGPGRPAVLGLVDDADPADPHLVQGFGTADTTPLVRVSLFDTGAHAGDHLVLNVDGDANAGLVLNADDLARGYVDVASGELGEGVHLISAQVVDTAGHAGPTAMSLPVRVDDTAPDVSFTAASGADGAQALADGALTTESSLVFHFAVDDHRGGAAAGESPGHDIYSGVADAVQVQLFANGVLVGESDVSGSGAGLDHLISSGDLAAGSYVFTLVATDAAGNSTQAADPFHLTIADASFGFGGAQYGLPILHLGMGWLF